NKTDVIGLGVHHVKLVACGVFGDAGGIVAHRNGGEEVKAAARAGVDHRDTVAFAVGDVSVLVTPALALQAAECGDAAERGDDAGCSFRADAQDQRAWARAAGGVAAWVDAFCPLRGGGAWRCTTVAIWRISSIRAVNCSG